MTNLVYRIAGNFGKVFNLVIWRFCGRKIAKFKTHQYLNNAYAHALAMCRIAKFKIHQCVLGNDSPNLMLAKVSRYTVCTHPIFYHMHVP